MRIAHPFKMVRRLAVMGAIVIGVALAPAVAAQADGTTGARISQSEVIARAHYWLSENVQYSQSASHRDPQGRQYRTDCSGFISMAWHLGESRNTGTLTDAARQLGSREDLEPGDILLWHSDDPWAGHVVLFEAWTDTAANRANLIELANPSDDMNYLRNVDIDGYGSAYKPYRYNPDWKDDGDYIFQDGYNPDNEDGDLSGGACYTSRPDDPTIDLPDRRDVFFEVDTCIAERYISGTQQYQYHVWIEVHWKPGTDGDDSSDTSKKRFETFMLHTQLQSGSSTKREIRCYIHNNINASYFGTRSCGFYYYTSSDSASLHTDGFVNWDIDGDGKYLLEPWYTHGSPAV